MMWCFTQLCTGAEADSQESPARTEDCIQAELTLVSLDLEGFERKKRIATLQLIKWLDSSSPVKQFMESWRT